jgi:phage baseplate assembly protein W
MKGLMINKQDVRIGVYDSTNNELIQASVERLLFCETGTMVGALNNGSRILDYFYEGASEATALAIIEEVKNLIKYNEPRIVLDAVGVNIVPADGADGLIILLKYHSVQNPDRKELIEFIKVRKIS